MGNQNNTPILPSNFKSQCFGCKHSYKNFRLNSDRRRHNKAGARCDIASKWPESQWNTLVSHLPDWKEELDISILPPLFNENIHASPDLFARWAQMKKSGNNDAIAELAPPLTEVKYNRRTLSKYLPYKRDFLAEHGWRCGSPVCWRSEHLQTWITHPKVHVLDMSTFYWSHTLKDLRTWAIVNVAQEHGFRHLAAWTAGNAGLSLAKITRACNHFLPADRRMRVYALYDSGDLSVKNNVIDTLESWECELIPVPDITRKVVFPPEELRSKVQFRAKGMSGFESEEVFRNQYLESTDGWDIGIVMYRLLFAQVIRDLRPTHIVLPLGTGNLAIGATLAVRDCYRNRPREIAPLIFGAQPDGFNITNQIRVAIEPGYVPTLPRRFPVMPKIANTYSALKPCVDHSMQKNEIIPILASINDQKAARDELDTPNEDRTIKSEPSSLAPFAVLPKLRGMLTGEAQKENILVVNSGFGLLSDEEREFLR